MFTRVTPLIVYLQVVVLLVITNYYLNPLVLNSNCLTGHASSESLGDGPIIDCSACINLDSRDFVESRLSGDIDILLPLSLPQHSSQNVRLPVDARKAEGNGALAQTAMIQGHVYRQEQCLQYECRSWLISSDFNLQNSTNQKKLASQGFRRLKEIKFTEESVVKKVFGRAPAEGSYKRIGSGSISATKACSLMVRFRYNPVENLDPQSQPVFIFSQISDNLFLRLLVIAPLFYDFARIIGLLKIQNIPFSTAFCLVLGVSFISEHLALVAASLALCLIGNLIDQKIHFIILAFGFPIVRIAHQFGYLPMFLSPLLIIVINGILVCLWRGKETKVELYQVVVVNCVHALLGGIYNWNFLVSVCPVLLFLGLAQLSSEEKQTGTSRNVHFNYSEEEEDVLMRNDRILQKR